MKNENELSKNDTKNINITSSLKRRRRKNAQLCIGSNLQSKSHIKKHKSQEPNTKPKGAQKAKVES